MKKQPSEGQRELGTIRETTSGDNDHGSLSTWTFIDLDSFGTQGFGGLALDKKGVKNFLAELCLTFDVSNIKQLKGKRCWVLRSFGTFNETIEGLESKDTGRRFTITGFRKKYYPKADQQNNLEYKRKQLEGDIAWAEGRIVEARAELKKIDTKYIDWETT